MIPKILQDKSTEIEIPYQNNQQDYNNNVEIRNKERSTFEKAFTVFVQAVFFLQYIALLTTTTLCVIFKLEWRHGNRPFQFTSFYNSKKNPVASLCQNKDSSMLLATVVWDWEGIDYLIQEGFNWLIGFQSFFLFAIVFLLLYLRHENWAPVIGVVVTWALIVLLLDYQWSWDYVWTQFVNLFEPIINIEESIVGTDDFNTFMHQLSGQVDGAGSIKQNSSGNNNATTCFMKFDFIPD